VLSITYETWKYVCEMYFSQKPGVLKSYLQWFPFSKLRPEEKKSISSEAYFQRYIQNGAAVLFPLFMLRTDNYLQKGDGSFRNSSLISPLLFLVLQAVGKTVHDKYKPNRPDSISVFYAGNYNYGRCHYKQDYDDFFKEINADLDEFDFFIKTDIRDFFGNIDPNKLMNMIDTNVNKHKIEIMQHHLQMYKELLSFCGNGRFPLIENSIASSFLATVVYLSDADITLQNFIATHISAFSSFRMVRYVDDLYILISSKKADGYLNEAYNMVINEYSSILKEIGLSLNTSKCCIRPTSEINEALKKYLYDEYFNGQKCQIANLCSNGILDFINKLSIELFFDHITVEKYNEIVDEIFSIDDVEFTSSEVFNYFIYENNESLSTAEATKALVSLIEQDLSFINLDPKRLTIMIMKNGSDKAIKAFLNQLFNRNRSGKWNSYDTTIAINYLIQSRFVHIDLLRIIKDHCPNLFAYCESFCKKSFFLIFNQSQYNKIVTLIGSDRKVWYLFYMYLVELSKGNTMSSFAYFKNYFDRVTAHLAYKTGYDHNGKKPNFNRFYKEKEIKKFYFGITDSVDIIEKAHSLRNDNPLAHASAGLIDNNSSTIDLLVSISNLKKLIFAKCTEKGVC